MDQLEKWTDVVEQKIKVLCEDLSRRLDQLAEMIRKCVPPTANE